MLLTILGECPHDQQAFYLIIRPHSFNAVNRTDGLRIIFDTQEIVHLRPSGNAPEFRCYTEADRPERALEMNEVCLGVMERWRDG